MKSWKVTRDLKKVRKKELIQVIESIRDKYPIQEMLKFLGVPKSSNYRWRKLQDKSNDEKLVNLIKQIFRKHKRGYGYRRVASRA